MKSATRRWPIATVPNKAGDSAGRRCEPLPRAARLACLACALGWLAAPVPLRAFPPAPHHEILGMVRDEMGNPLQALGARVVLETPAGVRYVGSIAPLTRPGINYRLYIPLDTGVTADLYKATALQPAASFRISVYLNGKLYLPIEMRGNLASLGQPTESTRLDLTLGEDADGDGIPDAWQKTLAKRLGVGMDQVKPGDDPDGDGLSNRDEYLAGTYAYDPAEGFELKAERDADGTLSMAFLAVQGRSYSLLGSVDLHEWHPVEFVVVAAGGTSGPLSTFQSADVRTTHIRPLAGIGGEVRLFRLKVE